MNKFWLTAGCALLLMMSGCSDAPSTPEKKAKAAEPISGDGALFKMFQVARSWAPDAAVMRLSSVRLTEVPSTPGKAGAWEALFTSEAKGRSRTYTYSVVEAEGTLHEGVFPGQERAWSGASGLTKPFLISTVQTGTEAAWKTALAKGSDYHKANPGKNIAFLLEWNEQFPDPAWRVIWGESAGTSNFSIFVDATTGEYLKTMR